MNVTNVNPNSLKYKVTNKVKGVVTLSATRQPNIPLAEGASYLFPDYSTYLLYKQSVDVCVKGNLITLETWVEGSKPVTPVVEPAAPVEPEVTPPQMPSQSSEEPQEPAPTTPKSGKKRYRVY